MSEKDFNIEGRNQLRAVIMQAVTDSGLNYREARSALNMVSTELQDKAENLLNDTNIQEVARTKSRYDQTIAEPYEFSIEDIKNADAENELEQAVKDAMLYSIEKTPDGEIEIRSYKDGLIKLENPEHVDWFVSQIQKLSGGMSRANY